MPLLKLIINFKISILILIGILYLSFAPPATFQGIPSFKNEDKIVHIFFYIALTGALIFEFNKLKTNKSFTVFFLSSICFPVFIGGLVEIIQPILYYPRTASWLDWFSDIAGVGIAWILMRTLKIFPINLRN